MIETDLAEKLYFSKEAAEYLGITVQRLNKLVQDGKLKPLKKNASGAVYHIDELNKRKEELAIFTNVKQGGEKGMFSFDTGTKIEALNYATLMNVLDCTEKTLEPKFEEFGKTQRLDVSMQDEEVLKEYALYFLIDPYYLQAEYKKAYEAFQTLRETDEIIRRDSQDYPKLLKRTKEAPRFLYLRGKKALLREDRTVAIVGSRMASEKANDNTRKVVDALGKNGITIVSGLAKGIDVTAHQEALDRGFNTIAVIGTSLNQYYPPENQQVQEAIEKRGLIVSQFSPANKTERWFFPLRNGTMSGLSLATVIMEAGETSGALKQADFAMKQGRPVLIPESALHVEEITWPSKYVGKGAKVVTKPIDIIEILANSDIYRIKNEPMAVQQTLMDYMSKPESYDSKFKDNAFTMLLEEEEDVPLYI